MEIKKYRYYGGDSYEAIEKVVIDKETLDYLSREPKKIRFFSGAFYRGGGKNMVARSPEGALENVENLKKLAMVAEGEELKDLHENPESYFLNFRGDSEYGIFQIDVPVTDLNIFPARFWVKRGEKMDAKNSLRGFLDRYLPDYEPYI